MKAARSPASTAWAASLLGEKSSFCSSRRRGFAVVAGSNWYGILGIGPKPGVRGDGRFGWFQCCGLLCGDGCRADRRGSVRRDTKSPDPAIEICPAHGSSYGTFCLIGTTSRSCWKRIFAAIECHWPSRWPESSPIVPLSPRRGWSGVTTATPVLRLTLGEPLSGIGSSRLPMSPRLGRLPAIPHRKCPLLPRASKIFLSNATPTLSIEKSSAPVRGLRPKSRPLVIRLEFAIAIFVRDRFLSVVHSVSSWASVLLPPLRFRGENDLERRSFTRGITRALTSRIYRSRIDADRRA